MRLRALVAFGLAVIGLSAALVGLSGQAEAGAPHDYPTTTCSTLSISTQNPSPGATVVVSGSGFLARASVRLVLSSRAPRGAAAFAQQRTAAATTYDLGTFTTDARGSFSASIMLPDSITNGGHYYIVAVSGFVRSSSGGACNVDPYQTLDIQAATTTSSSPGTTSTPGSTAFTGLNVAALIALGLVLIGAGAYVTQRGRRPAARR